MFGGQAVCSLKRLASTSFRRQLLSKFLVYCWKLSFEYFFYHFKSFNKKFRDVLFYTGTKSSRDEPKSRDSPLRLGKRYGEIEGW